MSRNHFRLFLCNYILLAILYIFVPVRLAAPLPAGNLSAFTRELDSRIPHILQDSRVPGATIALIQHGQVVWTKGYGLADVQQGTPVTPQTVFQAASISKTVTAWGVMKLVEDGTLVLDAPAESYLSRWHIPPSRFDSDEVTIRRLLNHTSGFAAVDYVGYPPAQPLPSLEESLTVGPPEPTDRMKSIPGSAGNGGARIVTQPGQAFVYSDSNYVLLQLIIEEVTGESFAIHMQREILSPLGMTDSSFARLPELIARTAIPYDAYGKPLPDFPFTELAPAGLYTTASDLGRFVAAGLPGAGDGPVGRGILTPDSVRVMTSPAVPIPGFEGWVYGDAYGLGYFVETRPGGNYLLSHSGGNLGWSCEFAASPSPGDGITIMTNSSIGHEVFAEALTLWTDWLGLDEAHIARSILLSHRVFQVLSVSMLLAAVILFVRLVNGIRSSARWFDLARLTLGRWLTAAACVVTAILYWTVVRSLMQINIPSQEPGMSWGVNFLCAALVANFLFAERDIRSL